jgi:hypothetical protein
MAKPASAFTSDLAVVYLARFAQGPKPVANFIESYNRYATGIDHDRVVIRKGFSGDNTEQDRMQSYSIDQWPKSGTFRLGDQRNLLVQDSHTRAFAALSRTEQRVFVQMTWGEELG